MDLKAAPFNLDRDAIAWVESTIGSMTLVEKIGQLLINHNNDYFPEYLDDVLDTYHVGGMRYRPGPSAAVQDHIRYAQSRTKVPLLVASNPEMGGFGSCDDGTCVCTHLQAGSHPVKNIARQMGQVAGVECTAIGCNWAFAPIVGIHYNWRNTVMSTRSFGNTPEIVVERAKEYFDGISGSNMVCTRKHFPGHGIDERDQYVVTSYNALGYDAWSESPPDASQTIGLTQATKRRDLVPGTIDAGCDMFLFFRNPAEGFQYMMDGYKAGIITGGAPASRAAPHPGAEGCRRPAQDRV